MITTIQTCDNCGAKVPVDTNNFWEVGIIVRPNGSYEQYYFPVRQQQWCSTCVEKHKLRPTGTDRASDPRPPEPTIEEMITRIVHNAIGNL